MFRIKNIRGSTVAKTSNLSPQIGQTRLPQPKYPIKAQNLNKEKKEEKNLNQNQNKVQFRPASRNLRKQIHANNHNVNDKKINIGGP